jgi:hypothetical protein
MVKDNIFCAVSMVISTITLCLNVRLSNLNQYPLGNSDMYRETEKKLHPVLAHGSASASHLLPTAHRGTLSARRY